MIETDIEKRREERKAQLAAVSGLPESDPYRRAIEDEVRRDVELYGE